MTVNSPVHKYKSNFKDCSDACFGTPSYVCLSVRPQEKFKFFKRLLYNRSFCEKLHRLSFQIGRMFRFRNSDSGTPHFFTFCYVFTFREKSFVGNCSDLASVDNRMFQDCRWGFSLQHLYGFAFIPDLDTDFKTSFFLNHEQLEHHLEVLVLLLKGISTAENIWFWLKPSWRSSVAKLQRKCFSPGTKSKVCAATHTCQLRMNGHFSCTEVWQRNASAPSKQIIQCIILYIHSIHILLIYHQRSFPQPCISFGRRSLCNSETVYIYWSQINMP